MTPGPPPQLSVALEALHYAYPAIVFFYFFVTLSITVCTLQSQRLGIQDEHVRRKYILAALAAVSTSYLLEIITVVLRYFNSQRDSPNQDHMVYLLSSGIVFGAQTVALTDSKFPIWYPYYGTWLLGLISESSFLIVGRMIDLPTCFFDFALIVEQALRVGLFIVLLALYFTVRTGPKAYENSDAEQQSLLQKKGANNIGSEASTLNGNSYGATTTTTSKDSDASSTAGSEDSWLARERKAKEAIKQRLQQDGNWFTYAKGFTIFLPYLWPVQSKTLQFRAVLVGFCLLGGNALNLLIPIWFGYMVKGLSAYIGGDKTQNVLLPVFVYAILGFIAGNACIGWLRRWLWMPIEQYSYKALSTAAHAHIMSLSSDFHDAKTTSDLTQAINGGQSVFDLVETVLFEIIPMFIDLAVAFGYLWIKFGPYMGLVMACFAVTYLYVTTKLYAVRAEKRRDFITVLRKEWTIGQQSLDGWITASLFNMIPYERERYGVAVAEHMKSKASYEMSAQYIGAVQSFIMTVGKIMALCLGVWQILDEKNDIGDFTTLIVYWGQLQAPLTFFSTMTRQVSNSLMDAERLLELFQTKPTIIDKPGVKPLDMTKGEIQFQEVSFAYDVRKPTLKAVSLKVPAGKTVALVGETGGGKSTILKLIDRFYDVKSGSISIDGQDIRDVTLSSLRDKIGVVPQDPTLFNDTVMNNIRYARLSASDEEVYEACKAAAVHDKIMSFPDGYNSKVGDRGVKLSGGEKQRVAIARAILKQPEIILLDEATSAVDTETEQVIQQGLSNLCKGRTTLIVAHRLSTIMRADIILVIMNGEVVEEGSHDTLVRSGGKYHDLWSKQIFVQPIDEVDGGKEDKDNIREGNDSKSTTQALGKDSAGGNKMGADSKTKNDAAEVHLTQGGNMKPVAKEDSDQKSSNGRGTSSSTRGHERFGFRAAVSEYVPSKIRVPSRSSSVRSASKGSPTKDNPRTPKKEAKEEQKRQEKERREAASLSKKKGEMIAKEVESPVTRTGGNAVSGGHSDVRISGLDGTHSSEASGTMYEEREAEGSPRLGAQKGLDEGEEFSDRFDGGNEAQKKEFAVSTESEGFANPSESTKPVTPTQKSADPLARYESTKPAEPTQPTGIPKPAYRRRRPTRRHASRSEPMPGKYVDNPIDGAGSSGTASGDPRETQAPLSGLAPPIQQQMRRVSAPSDPPPGPLDRRAGRKRQRHWRLRSRSSITGNKNLEGGEGVRGGLSSEDAVRVGAPVSSPVERGGLR